MGRLMRKRISSTLLTFEKRRDIVGNINARTKRVSVASTVKRVRPVETDTGSALKCISERIFPKVGVGYTGTPVTA